MKSSQHAFISREYTAKCLRLRVLGAARGIGGRKTLGIKTNGIWRLILAFLTSRAGRLRIPGRNTAFIAFITTSFVRAGSCEDFSIDVYRTSRAFRFQFSRRSIYPRRVSRRVRRAWHDGNGSARQGRCVWRAAFLPSCKKGKFFAGALGR